MIITGYFCAPVRGQKGDNVDPQTKLDNVALGIAIGQAVAGAFPCLDLFIPHEHEEIIDILWRNGLLSEKIIDACCEIVKQRQVIFIYTGNGISKGMEREMDVASVNGVFPIEFEEWNDFTRERISRDLMEIGIEDEDE